MYKLTRVCLTNWYLVVAKDVDVLDATAFIGPTGAGKSSVQDAIQTVMCGGSHRHVHPNASASGKSERKIQDYCLGYLVPKKDGGQPLRPSCETVLALVFSEERPDGSLHHVSVGLALSARVEDSRETVITRFIAPGLRFSVDMIKETDSEGTVLRRWEDVERSLKNLPGAVHFYRHGSEKFVADMLAEMRRHGRQPDTRHFLNAFSNAVAFKPIHDPNAFARTYLVEPDPLEIDRVREAIRRWRELADAVRLIEEKLRKLTVVRRRYADWGAAVIDRATDRWNLSCAVTEKAKEAVRAATRERAAAQEALDLANHIRKRLRADQTSAEEELARLRGMMNDLGLDGKLQQIDVEKENIELRLANIETEDRKIREALLAASNLATAFDYLPASYRSIVSGAREALDILGKSGLDWLVGPGARDVAAHVAKLASLSGLQGSLGMQSAAKLADVAVLRAARAEIEENARRAASGATPLSRHTLAYIRLLKEQEVEAEVLCDVVEVVDPRWQFAAESLLGAFREAIIVSPRHLKLANDILYANRNRHDLHRIRLVKTNRTETVDTKLAADSIATILRSDNPHAMATICTHLGGFKKVETAEELARATRAIMPDGRATSGFAYSVNRDLPVLLLGRKEGSAAADLAAEAARLKADIAKLDREIAILSQTQRVADRLSEFSADIEKAVFAYEEIRRQRGDLDRRRQSVMSDEDRALAAEIEGVKAEIAGRSEEIEEAEAVWSKATGKLSDAKSALRSATHDLRNAVRTKRAAIELLDTDDLVVALKWQDADAPAFNGTLNPVKSVRTMERFDAVIKTSSDRLKGADDHISRLAAGARTALDAYVREYGIERPVMDSSPYTFDYNWVVRSHLRLQQNELREHKDQAESAEREMYVTLKEDLLINLNGRFQKLDIQIRTLNAQLRRHTFTGQTYRLTRKPDPRFERLRRLAMTVGENPDQAQAIVENRMGDLVLRAAMDELNEFLESSGGEGMEDYRNYFIFDLQMRPVGDVGDDDESLEIDEVEAKKRNWITLSGRASVGSGGEGQAPFYVAIAASMALAYYPGGHSGGQISGMGLVLFDEAFNKLDIVTTQSLIRFFKDIGLQLILAAPEDKRPTFTEVLDCIVSVNKDADRRVVYLDSEYPTPYARERIGEINPDHIGIEGYRRRLEKILA
jgi:hypothetical protein